MDQAKTKWEEGKKWQNTLPVVKAPHRWSCRSCEPLSTPLSLLARSAGHAVAVKWWMHEKNRGVGGGRWMVGYVGGWIRQVRWLIGWMEWLCPSRVASSVIPSHWVYYLPVFVPRRGVFPRAAAYHQASSAPAAAWSRGPKRPGSCQSTNQLVNSFVRLTYSFKMVIVVAAN